MHRLVLIGLASISTAVATPGVSDLTLYQIAANTLNSVRELNEIVTEQREFSENFERVYSKVDQAVWKADRSAMWLEDMQAMGEVSIEELDDFNYVLSSLKTNTEFLRRKLVEYRRDNKNTENRKRQAKKEVSRSQKRLSKYSSGAKSSMSPQIAQVETAKNTKDLVLESARLNTKVDKLTIEVGNLTSIMQKREERRLKKEIIEKDNLNQSEKGILSNRELKK